MISRAASKSLTVRSTKMADGKTNLIRALRVNPRRGILRV